MKPAQPVIKTLSILEKHINSRNGCATLQPAPCGSRRMTQGQRGSLLLHCVTLSFTTLCRSPGAFEFLHFPRGEAVEERPFRAVSPAHLQSLGFSPGPLAPLITNGTETISIKVRCVEA